MKSIHRHLTVRLVLSSTFLLVVGSVAIYCFTRAALLHEFDAGLRDKALTLITLTEQDQGKLKLEFPEKSAPEFKSDSAPEFYEVWLADGTTFNRSESLKAADLPRRFGPVAKPKYWNLELPGDISGRAIGLKYSPRTEHPELQHSPPLDVILAVVGDRGPLNRTLATLATVLVVTGLLTLAVTVPVVRFSLRCGHAPLEQLAHQTARITAHSLQARFPVHAVPEELLPITTRLNDLLSRLEESFERERRFSADLAHELRTPLAELRCLAEVELEWAQANEAEKHRETLDIALQMQAIVTRLLELAHCEHGKPVLPLASVSIAPLAEKVWRSLADKANKKELGVIFQVPADATIKADGTLFRSILSNLFSNAVEYTPQGGRVEIVWCAEANELAVSNTVDDLTADDLPHLFERLWRKDKSRTGGEHYGLGLSLSRAFAELSGLTLAARFSDPTTLTLTLRTM